VSTFDGVDYCDMKHQVQYDAIQCDLILNVCSYAGGWLLLCRSGLMVTCLTAV